MKKTIKQRFFLSLCLLMLFSLFGGGNLAWAQGTTVTYKVSSTSAVTTSGTAPSSSSATFKNTYSTQDKLTKGNKMTLTLSGYAGQKITGLTLSMKSNSSNGAGYLDVKAGTKQLAKIGSSASGVSFSNAAWHGSWSQSYVDVVVSLLDDTYIIQGGEDVVIVIGATANSLYCQSFTLTYEAGGSSEPLPDYNVSWMVNGASYTAGDPSTSVKSGERVTALPTEPAAIGTKKFVGWTNAQIAAAQSTEPAVLFNTPEKAPAVTGNVTYYAVFATGTVTSDAKSLSEITDGGVYHIVATQSATNYYLKANQNAGAGKRGSTTDVEEAGEFILEGSGNTWAIKVKGTEYYMALNGTNASVTYKNAAANYTVTDQTDAMKFVIGERQLCLNGGTTSNFGSYSIKTTTPVYIWLKGIGNYSDYCTTLPDVQLSVGKTGYATLYYSNFDLVVPENTEAYTFRSENGALMESVRYDEGEVIPAGEAVVVYTINDVPCTLNFRKFIANVARDASSQLAGTDEEVLIAQDDACYFYGLSLNSGNDINSVGFYWMVDGGAAFTNGAHKAYLKIPTSEFEGAQPVRGFAFKGTTTGVESVESSNNVPQAIYDLTGRRVSKAEKGIYIINGKKVIK